MCLECFCYAYFVILLLSINPDCELPTVEEIRAQVLNWHAEDRKELEETRNQRVNSLESLHNNFLFSFEAHELVKSEPNIAREVSEPLDFLSQVT